MKIDTQKCIATLDGVLDLNQGYASLLFMPLSDVVVREELSAHYKARGYEIDFVICADNGYFFIDLLRSDPIGGGKDISNLVGREVYQLPRAA